MMASPVLCWSALLFSVAVFLPFSTAVDFVDSPGNVAVHVGETAILQCSVNLNNVQGSMTLYWYKVSTSGRIYVTIGQAVQAKAFGAERYSLDTSNVRGIYRYDLRITGAEIADSGQYQCMAVNRGGTSRSQPGNLSVVQEANNEPLRCSFYPDAPTLGQTVTFSCIAPRGVSPDILTWWMDGRVQIQPEAHLANEHGISFVKTLEETDNFAEFTCLVGSSFSTRNAMNCSVTPLAVPIRAEVTPSVQNAVIAGNATFQCRGTAIPPVTRYRWLYGSGENTIKISERKGRFFVVNNGDSSSLIIASLTAEDNNKMVRCAVMNSITKTFGLAELHVSTTRMDITSQQTPSSAQTDEASTLGTTIARTIQEMTETTPFMKSTKAEVLDTTQNHATKGNGIGFVTNGHDCVKDCGEQISPQPTPSGNVGRSGNRATAAVFSLLAMCALLIIGVIVHIYIVYKKNKGPKAGGLLKRKLQKNEASLWLRSPKLSTVSNSNQDLVEGDSVRFKTIEVVVNPPAPEWQFRVHDVTIEQVTQDVNTTGDNPSPVMTSDDNDGRKDDGEVDALYAKADPMKKKKKKPHCGPEVVGVDAHMPVESPPSAVAGSYPSVATYGKTFGLGCEKTDDMHKDGDVTYAELSLATDGEVGKTRSLQTETVDYANITITDRSENFDML